jgi:hypothetical protein
MKKWRVVTAVSFQPVQADDRVQFQVILSGICGGESNPGTEFSLSTSVLPLWYHSNNAPYYVHLSAMVCNRDS